MINHILDTLFGIALGLFFTVVLVALQHVNSMF